MVDRLLFMDLLQLFYYVLAFTPFFEYNSMSDWCREIILYWVVSHS